MSQDLFFRAFRNKSTRRIFTFFVLSICAVLIIARCFIDDFSFSRISGDVLESLLATFLSALGIAAFLRFFVPRDVEREITLREPRDLKDDFAYLLENSDSWKYKGNFGRYFRTVTLPVLSRKGVDKHISIEVDCIVIDPDNLELCELHVNARNSVRTADGKRDWTVRDVRLEVYSTILCCFIYKNTINVRLGLLGYFESQRFDIASSAVIVTREDTRAPAVKISKDSYLFSAIRRDYQVAMSQCRLITVAVNRLSMDDIDVDMAKKILIDAGLDSIFVVAEIVHICEKAKTKSNPYV